MTNNMNKEQEFSDVEKAIFWTASTVLEQTVIADMMQQNEEFKRKVYTPLNDLVWNPYFENIGQKAVSFDLTLYLEDGFKGRKNSFEHESIKTMEQVLEDIQKISSDFFQNEEENSFAKETQRSIEGLLLLSINILNGTTENLSP